LCSEKSFFQKNKTKKKKMQDFLHETARYFPDRHLSRQSSKQTKKRSKSRRSRAYFFDNFTKIYFESFNGGKAKRDPDPVISPTEHPNKESIELPPKFPSKGWLDFHPLEDDNNFCFGTDRAGLFDLPNDVTVDLLLLLAEFGHHFRVLDRLLANRRRNPR
jgi:hypothetical protein